MQKFFFKDILKPILFDGSLEQVASCGKLSKRLAEK